jgi:hypothetical protein
VSIGVGLRGAKELVPRHRRDHNVGQRLIPLAGLTVEIDIGKCDATKLVWTWRLSGCGRCVCTATEQQNDCQTGHDESATEHRSIVGGLIQLDDFFLSIATNAPIHTVPAGELLDG